MFTRPLFIQKINILGKKNEQIQKKMEKPKSKSEKSKKHKNKIKGTKRKKTKRENIGKTLTCPFAFLCIYFAFSICLFLFICCMLFSFS